MTWKTMCEGNLCNSNNIPTNFCFLYAELLLVIGGNCNACHPMAIGRLPGHLRANSGSISGH